MSRPIHRSRSLSLMIISLPFDLNTGSTFLSIFTNFPTSGWPLFSSLFLRIMTDGAAIYSFYPSLLSFTNTIVLFFFFFLYRRRISYGITKNGGTLHRWRFFFFISYVGDYMRRVLSCEYGTLGVFLFLGGMESRDAMGAAAGKRAFVFVLSTPSSS